MTIRCLGELAEGLGKEWNKLCVQETEFFDCIWSEWDRKTEQV